MPDENVVQFEKESDDSSADVHQPGVRSGLSQELGNDIYLPTVLEDVLSTAMHQSGAQIGSIIVLDEAGRPSHWRIMRGDRGWFVPPVHAQPIIQQGILAQIRQQRHGDCTPDLVDAPQWWSVYTAHRGFDPDLSNQDVPAPAPSRGSALCLPVLTYGRVVALITLFHDTPGRLNAQHLSALELFVDQVALSVESARLYEAARRRAGQMAALYEVALNLTADQPLSRLLDTVVAQAMDLLRCQGGGVYLWRASEEQLELVAMYDPEIDLRGTRVAPGEGLVGRVFDTGDPLAVHEYPTWRGEPTNATEADLISGLPWSAALAVPLIWQGRQLGVLLATDRTPDRYFGHDDRRLLMLLANQAAAAIASVELHEQTARRLQELTFLNETIQAITATLDLDKIFAVLTARVKDLLGIEACSIALVDRETRQLVFRVASGGGAETVVGERVPWGQGIVGAAAESGQPVNVADVSQDERFFRAIDAKQSTFVTQSILAVPMTSRGRVVGVVEALNKPGGFDSEDERLLSALATLAASVVENADLVAAQRELEQLRENLTHMVVHDLRSPLGTISNSLDMLQRSLQNNELDQSAYLINIATRSAQRVLNLVESLLDTSRLEAGQKLLHRRPVALPELIQSAADQMALYRQRKRIRMELDWPEQLPTVNADREMLERVLVNLLDNAFKFTPIDGVVAISVKVANDALLVRVQDNGPGIPPEYHRQVFDKFARVRTQGDARGIGLGLAFCRLAVEAHGGRIWVESSSDQGSTFAFTIPLN